MSLQIGMRLRSIGLPRHEEDTVPGEGEAEGILQAALDLGIRLFDTAASYGPSEERLGLFMDQMSLERRQALTIATKFGAHFDPDKNEVYYDHRYDALCRSLDISLDRLEMIDILHLQGTTEELLDDPELEKALAYARVAGIPILGACVDDVDTALKVAEDPRFDAIQVAYNLGENDMGPAIDAAAEAGKLVYITRPYADGQLAPDPLAAFADILGHGFHGAVLTGTRSPAHLAFNVSAFRIVVSTRDA